MLFVPCLPMPSTERHLPNRRSAKPRLNAMATDSASESREREFASHSLSNDVMTSLAGINDKRLRLLVSAAVSAAQARTSVVSGKSVSDRVDIGGRRILK